MTKGWLFLSVGYLSIAMGLEEALEEGLELAKIAVDNSVHTADLLIFVDSLIKYLTCFPVFIP